MNAIRRSSDQADTLRRLTGYRATPSVSPQPPAREQLERSGPRVISITSGKGGVGKSSLAANLAIALAKAGKRVLIIDADLGLANIDVILGLQPRYTLNDMFSGEQQLSDIIVDGPCGIKLLPAGSGVQKYTSLDSQERLRLLDELDRLEDEFDIFLIDTEGGISENVTYFNVAAQEIVVVVSPEPTSLTDGYALIKLLSTRYAERYFKVLVNMANDYADARQVFSRLTQVTNRFLDVSIDYLGCVLRDEAMIQAIKRQKAVVELYPETAAARCFATLATRIIQEPVETQLKGNIQFFSRRLYASSRGLE